MYYSPQNIAKQPLSLVLDKIEWIEVYSNDISVHQFVEAVLEFFVKEDLSKEAMLERVVTWKEQMSNYATLEALPQNQATDYYQYIITCYKTLINSVQQYVAGQVKTLQVLTNIEEAV